MYYSGREGVSWIVVRVCDCVGVCVGVGALVGRCVGVGE